MNKQILFFACMLFACNSYGQSYQKGDWNFDAGIGLGVFSTETKFSIPLPIIGTVTFSDDDGAASVIIPISAEYAVSDRFGVGLQLNFSNYFIDDSTEVYNIFTGEPTGQMQENNTQSVNSFAIAVKANFHLMEHEQNDLFVGIAVGGSGITWKWKDMEEETLDGSGSYFNLYIMDRIYFTEKVGMNFNLGFTSYNYDEVKSSSSTAIENLEFKGSGVTFSVGPSFKF
ncbi:MAG: hypothetical protein HKO56_02240 [Bacteroidia bacterium]|nr:hypothetical protein [Bacteroidia bacterium]NNM15450.1 hypothetical protein [Bacteroidia bacterium]